MKLKKLHLYGFGRFQDFRIDLTNEPIHVFLGKNEAGKSTIMAFIRCIFFGFPTKQQSELRYEPRLGGRYGGSIVLETAKFGRVTVERIHGKATGDAKVYFSDGSIGGDSELKLVLSEIDRTIFSGIYSFGLTDLQTMEQLQSDELNKFMYGVGISGRNNLLEIEKKNEKLLQALYKPSGRKPLINERLKNITELEEKVSSWRKKLSNHEQLIKERNTIVETIKKGGEDELKLNREYRYFERLQTIAPIFLKKKIYENRLQLLPPYQPFPEDGLQRLEKFNDHCVLVEGEKIDIEKRQQNLHNEIEKLQVNGNLGQLGETIEQIKESRKIYESKRDEKNLLLQQLEYEQNEYEQMVAKLGYRNAAFETSFVAEQKLAKLIETDGKIKQQEFFLQSQLEQARNSLETKESEIANLKSELLDEKERGELEEKVANQLSEKELAQRLYYVDDSLNLVNNQMKQFTTQKSNRKNFLLIATTLLSVFGALLLIQNSQHFFALLFIIVPVLIIVFLKVESKNTMKTVLADLKKQKEQLTFQKQELVAEIQKRGNDNDNLNLELLKKDQQKRELLYIKEQSLNEVNEHYEHICSELDKWEYSKVIFQENLQSWATEFNYPLELCAEHYLMLLKMMEEVKKKHRQLTYLKDKLATLKQEIFEFETKVDHLCEKMFLTINTNSYLQKVERLSISLKKEQETERLLSRLIDQQNQLNETRKTAETKLIQFKQEINKLFQLAGVKNEEEFRQKGKAWLESQHINEQLRIYNSQISPFIESEANYQQVESDIFQYKDTFGIKLSQLDKQIKEIRTEINNCHEQLAKINQDIKDLEEGSSYSISLHNFENEKGILNSEVKKWAFYRAVQFLIDEAKKVYEKERQPHVVKEATRMFHYMTGGEYVQLFAPIGEQRLFVERKDGLKFQPNELSQGTKEQLYLSIRLALATVHSKQTSFPIFIDDIFVNFDAMRRVRAIELIKEMSKEHQIIFFTCHPFMADEISKRHFPLNDDENTTSKVISFS